MVAKKQRTLCQPMMRCKRTLYRQQTDKDKNTDENQPGPSLRHSKWLEGYKFIYSNVLNELISNKLCCQCKKQFLAIQKDAVRKGLDERLVVYLMFICLIVSFIDERIADAAVDKIENYYEVAIQSNIVIQSNIHSIKYCLLY